MARELTQLYDGRATNSVSDKQEPVEGSALQDLHNPDDEDSVGFY